MSFKTLSKHCFEIVSNENRQNCIKINDYYDINKIMIKKYINQHFFCNAIQF